jgi:proteic killer suppression protein
MTYNIKDSMTRVDLSKVKKELYKLPNYIVLKLYRWVDGVEKDGIDEMRKIPGFHEEPLKGSRAGTRSIRLNKGYRVIYTEYSEINFEIIRIEEVNKHEY